MSYQQLANIYDRLMEDAPYDEWLLFIERISKKYNHSIKNIIDLGCGTGTIAIPLAKEGYNVIGVDLSEDMLSMAQQKSRNEGVSVQWLQQDMSKFEVPDSVDTILCFCDSLNYITDAKLVQDTFQRVYDHLSPSGLFLFDTHSIYKLEHIFGDNMFGSNDEELTYIWQSFYDYDKRIVDHELSFFLENGSGLYHRFNEFHQQKGYLAEELSTWLLEAGFELKELIADFQDQEPTAQSERLFFVAQKK
jgi:ubiquinone/menaquinone biosynthesis C-methylase UbiE